MRGVVPSHQIPFCHDVARPAIGLQAVSVRRLLLWIDCHLALLEGNVGQRDRLAHASIRVFFRR